MLIILSLFTYFLTISLFCSSISAQNITEGIVLESGALHTNEIQEFIKGSGLKIIGELLIDAQDTGEFTSVVSTFDTLFQAQQDIIDEQAAMLKNFSRQVSELKSTQEDLIQNLTILRQDSETAMNTVVNSVNSLTLEALPDVNTLARVPVTGDILMFNDTGSFEYVEFETVQINWGASSGPVKFLRVDMDNPSISFWSRINIPGVASVDPHGGWTGSAYTVPVSGNYLVGIYDYEPTASAGSNNAAIDCRVASTGPTLIPGTLYSCSCGTNNGCSCGSPIDTKFCPLTYLTEGTQVFFEGYAYTNAGGGSGSCGANAVLELYFLGA